MAQSLVNIGRKSEKPWVDALRIAVNEDDNGVRKLRRIAEKTVQLAMAGDMSAIQEIGNRLDGKPAVTIDVQRTEIITDDRELARRLAFMERLVSQKPGDDARLIEGEIVAVEPPDGQE